MILEATLRLFKRDRELHTAATISKEAKIAKGTLYLYFKTKEEIYMELLVSNFRRWHEILRNYLLDSKPTAEELIEYMCRSLADFTAFVDLFGPSRGESGRGLCSIGPHQDASGEFANSSTYLQEL
jgi:AcrR family transcriptional regulator